MAKLNTAGTALVYSTYLRGTSSECSVGIAGTSSECSVGIALDSLGSAHVTGYTFSPDFPVHDPLKSALTGGGIHAFITKLNPAGSALAWSTYLGGSARDGGSAIGIDGSGNVDAANQTNSNDFPTTSGAFQTSLAGDSDGSVVNTASSTSNAAPVITSISGPLGPLALGTPATLAATFTDADAQDLHTCTLLWDDGLPATNGTVTETAGSGSCTGTRTYTTAGIYTVSVTVVDDHRASASKTFEFVVIYHPTASFVTGGGWINSPAGAYVADPSLTGKANFGFFRSIRKVQVAQRGKPNFSSRLPILTSTAVPLLGSWLPGRKRSIRAPERSTALVITDFS